MTAPIATMSVEPEADGAARVGDRESMLPVSTYSPGQYRPALHASMYALIPSM